MRTKLLQPPNKTRPLRPKPLQLKLPKRHHNKHHKLRSNQPPKQHLQKLLSPLKTKKTMMSQLPDNNLQPSRPKWTPKSTQSKIREKNKRGISKSKEMIQQVNYRVS